MQPLPNYAHLPTGRNPSLFHIPNNYPYTSSIYQYCAQKCGYEPTVPYGIRPPVTRKPSVLP
jgi:hypothetical protein